MTRAALETIVVDEQQHNPAVRGLGDGAHRHWVFNQLAAGCVAQGFRTRPRLAAIGAEGGALKPDGAVIESGHLRRKGERDPVRSIGLGLEVPIEPIPIASQIRRNLYRISLDFADQRIAAWANSLPIIGVNPGEKE